jgi:hypothetical protein
MRSTAGMGGLAAFAAGNPCLLGREFVGTSLSMGSLPALAGDLTTLLGIH